MMPRLLKDLVLFLNRVRLRLIRGGGSTPILRTLGNLALDVWF